MSYKGTNVCDMNLLNELALLYKVVIFRLSVHAADDEASSKAAGLWSGGGERHQRPRLLPLHRLGETGKQGGAATVQTASCKSDPT